MFNLTHILYMVISALITAVLLVLAGIFVKQEKYKTLILRILAVVTVVLHFSDLYVDFFTTGTATLASPQLLPIHPCNVIMWLLLICAFVRNRESKAAKILMEFCFYAGVVCGTIGIVLNENFGNNPTLTDWFVLKGMLSHSTMLAGCIYILVAKFFKVRVSNLIAVFLGLCLFIVDGLIINGLYAAFKIGECNSMYLLTPPLENAPWFNTWLMGIFGLLLVFAVTALYEQFALKKEERWYAVLKDKINEIKDRKNKGDNNERISD